MVFLFTDNTLMALTAPDNEMENLFMRAPDKIPYDFFITLISCSEVSLFVFN